MAKEELQGTKFYLSIAAVKNEMVVHRIVSEIHSSKHQRYLKPQENERNLLFGFHVYDRLMRGRKPGT